MLVGEFQGGSNETASVCSCAVLSQSHFRVVWRMLRSATICSALASGDCAQDTCAIHALAGGSMQLGRSKVPVVSLVILESSVGHPSGLRRSILRGALSSAVRLLDGNTLDNELKELLNTGVEL